MTSLLVECRPTLFMDIDGTLLIRRSSAMFDAFNVAPHCLDFLEFATSRFDCRWLSSRCRYGFIDGSRRAFRSAGAPLDDARWAVLDLIKPALWSASKVEAIDPSSNFWWIDDDPTETERDWLHAHGRKDRLIEVSSDRNPSALCYARSQLTMALTSSLGLQNSIQPDQHREKR